MTYSPFRAGVCGFDGLHYSSPLFGRTGIDHEGNYRLQIKKLSFIFMALGKVRILRFGAWVWGSHRNLRALYNSLEFIGVVA